MNSKEWASVCILVSSLKRTLKFLRVFIQRLYLYSTNVQIRIPVYFSNKGHFFQMLRAYFVEWIRNHKVATQEQIQREVWGPRPSDPTQSRWNIFAPHGNSSLVTGLSMCPNSASLCLRWSQRHFLWILLLIFPNDHTPYPGVDSQRQIIFWS